MTADFEAKDVSSPGTALFELNDVDLEARLENPPPERRSEPTDEIAKSYRPHEMKTTRAAHKLQRGE
jgi:hypothetical protein